LIWDKSAGAIDLRYILYNAESVILATKICFRPSPAARRPSLFEFCRDGFDDLSCFFE
jgi:hypothetical protein